MNNILPYSVVKSKRTKHIRIYEDTNIAYDSKNREIDYEKQIEEISKAGISDGHELNLISNFIEHFSRNNIAVLLLAFKVYKHGEDFYQTEQYKLFFDYIYRKSSKTEISSKKSEVIKVNNFESRLKFQVSVYIKKIKKLIDNRVINI